MQSLTRQWSQKTAAALERCRSAMQTKYHYNPCLFCEENPNQIRAREVFQSVLSFLRGFPSWIPALSIYSRLFSGYLYSKSLEEKPGCSQGKKVAKCQAKPCYVSITNHHMQTYPEKQAPTQQYLMASFVLQYTWGSSKWWKEILSEMWKLDEILRKNERSLKNKYSRTVWRTAGATESIWGKANSKNWSIFLSDESGGEISRKYYAFWK